MSIAGRNTVPPAGGAATRSVLLSGSDSGSLKESLNNSGPGRSCPRCSNPGREAHVIADCCEDSQRGNGTAWAQNADSWLVQRSLKLYRSWRARLRTRAGGRCTASRPPCAPSCAAHFSRINCASRTTHVSSMDMRAHESRAVLTSMVEADFRSVTAPPWPAGAPLPAAPC